MRHYTPAWIAGAVLFFFSTAAASLRAQEVQQHGFVFENWICDTFFDGYRPQYTEKWDIPAAINTEYGGVPVNPKAVRYGTAVDLGDALRQYNIDETFLLIIGYWEQKGDHKEFTNIIAPRIEPETWRQLWHPITRENLERLDAIIKDREIDYKEARKQAHAMKNEPPFTEAIMVVNPKIDALGQRRLQCSIRFHDLFKHLAPEENSAPLDTIALWGVTFPGKIYSPPRQVDPPD